MQIDETRLKVRWGGKTFPTTAMFREMERSWTLNVGIFICMILLKIVLFVWCYAKTKNYGKVNILSHICAKLCFVFSVKGWGHYKVEAIDQNKLNIERSTLVYKWIDEALIKKPATYLLSFPCSVAVFGHCGWEKHIHTDKKISLQQRYQFKLGWWNTYMMVSA